MRVQADVQTLVGLLALVYMIYRSYSRKSLTPSGIATAAVVGLVHAVHPYRLLALLLMFFVCGTKLTSWGGDVKAELLTDDARDTKSDSSTKGARDQTSTHEVKKEKKEKKGRTATQVLCNSLPATVLALAHLYFFSTVEVVSISHSFSDLLIVGVIAQYACSAADTFSSEIGILNDGWPVLITTFRKVPPGTNGGVSVLGLVAALMGGAIIGLTAFIVPTNSWMTKVVLLLTSIAAGLFGSLVDSLLGATMQRTVYNAEMKKVIEMHGGTSLQHWEAGERYIVLGYDLLDNNQVNLVSAAITVICTMGMVASGSYIWSLLT